MTSPEDKRDTLPPDFRAMDHHALLVYLADAMFVFRQEQREQGESLKGMRAELTLLTQHVELIGNQLVTGDEDPRTIAQRIQSLENDSEFTKERVDHIAGRMGYVPPALREQELTPINHQTFNELHAAELQRRGRGGE